MSGTCQADVGAYILGPIPLAGSLRHNTGCTEPATVTLRAGCVHEHIREKRFCAFHGQVNPDSADWFCRECAELGHECPITPEVAAEAGP